MPAEESSPPQPSFPAIPRWGFWSVWGVTLAAGLWWEWYRLDAAGLNPWNPIEMFAHPDRETTLVIAWLLLAPIFWVARKTNRKRESEGGRWFGTRTCPRQPNAFRFGWRELTLALLVAGVSLSASWSISQMEVSAGKLGKSHRFGELPPAFHDEFAYRFQARTFLEGRVNNTPHPELPYLFDQMHVINEPPPAGNDEQGIYAGRYFPATAVWLMPWEAMGEPVWGQWLAGMLSAVLLFLAGRELGGNGVGLLAGLLLGISPGVSLFSNLLLAHHATLLGLTLFLYAFLRMRRTTCIGFAWLAGCGLMFAMLARPMSAAGFALPFGLWFLLWWIFPREDVTAKRRSAMACGLGLPLVIGLLGLGWYSYQITGSPTVTPYQFYTDQYTPRHVYGFNNVKRGEERLTDRLVKGYDEWAENLTGKLAAKNVKDRLIATGQMAVGLAALVLATLLFLLSRRKWAGRWRLVFLAIITMHLAHVPYWFVGMMNWHYVFETAALWCLLFAGVTFALCSAFRSWGRPAMGWWWIGLVALSTALNWLPGVPEEKSRVQQMVSQVGYPRLRQRAFRESVAHLVSKKPALVLVIPDESDTHLEFTVNRPGLSAPVLFAKRTGRYSLEEISKAFPDRAIYLFDARGRFSPALRRGEERTNR